MHGYVQQILDILNDMWQVENIKVKRKTHMAHSANFDNFSDSI